jgi:tRNA dimethylallyltransferase
VTARPRLLAIVGPTATGKSALGIELACRLGGEVVACDSTAVYSRVRHRHRQGAAARRSGGSRITWWTSRIRSRSTPPRGTRGRRPRHPRHHARGRLPILVGGTGLYYRALVRGFFPGPGRDAALRARFERVADRRGVERLHAMLARVDPPSAVRIQPRDRKRIIRALEVHRLTGRPLTEHFAETTSPLAEYDVIAFALQIPAELTAARVAARVDAQFEQGIVDEVRGLLASGLPATAHPFTGLVYRQVLEYLRGERDEAATRELIVRENRRYARRQLIWFRKEPNLRWLRAAGEPGSTADAVVELLNAGENAPHAAQP